MTQSKRTMSITVMVSVLATAIWYQVVSPWIKDKEEVDVTVYAGILDQVDLINDSASIVREVRASLEDGEIKAAEHRAIIQAFLDEYGMYTTLRKSSVTDAKAELQKMFGVHAIRSKDSSS